MLSRKFKGARRTIKVHILEHHMLDCIRAHLAGCGLMGEQGADSIHFQLNSLAAKYKTIPDLIDRLKCIMKEHYLKSLFKFRVPHLLNLSFVDTMLNNGY